MRTHNLTKLITATLFLTILLFIGLPETPTFDEDPQFPTENEPIEFYTPNGVIATNIVAWDTGVLEYLPEGYSEFYDEYAAVNGVIIPYQASTLDASLVDIPNYNRSKDIAEHIMPSLVLRSLRMVTGTAESEINERYLFSEVPASNWTALLHQKKHLIDLFNTHFEPSNKYKRASELDCEFSSVDAIKKPSLRKSSGEETIYKLSNFKIELDELTSVLQLSCRKIPENESVFIKILPSNGEQENDPNNFVPKMISFLEKFQNCLNDQVYITPNRIQPRYSPTPGLHLNAELSAMYLFPILTENFSCSSATPLVDQCEPEIPQECEPTIDNRIPAIPNSVEFNELDSVGDEKKETAVETSVATQTKTKVEQIIIILTNIQAKDAKQLRDVLRLQKELVVLIGKAESTSENDLLKRLITKLRRATKSLHNGTSADSVILRTKVIKKLLRKISKRLPEVTF